MGLHRPIIGWLATRARHVELLPAVGDHAATVRIRRPSKTLNEILLDQAEQRRTATVGDIGLPTAQTEKPVRVEASDAAARFIRARGGRAYVWVEGVGLLRTTTSPPSQGPVFLRYQGDGFELHQDEGIVTPHLWKLRRRFFPPGIVALWNEKQGSADGGVG